MNTRKLLCSSLISFSHKGGSCYWSKWRRLFLALFMLVISHKASATHISGASLTYKWITGNTFELRLTLYRDCSGIAAPNSVSVYCNSLSCGYTINTMLNKVSGSGEEITRPCDTSATNCTSGLNPGIQKFEYTANITLPGHCTDWIFGYSICCRNCAITTISYTPNNCAGVPGTYVEAQLNNFNAPSNSSPVFTNDPVYFYCIGQSQQYNLGVTDADGDSLVYTLVNPQSSSSNNLIFNPGYSASNPISSSPPLSLSATGDIRLNPTSPEVGVLAIKISEYRNGMLIGSVVQDIQMWTSNCNNNLPTLSGINGTSNYSAVVCPGTPLQFQINSNDANAGQVISMTWNQSIPGASFTTTNDPFPTGTFSWTPTVTHIRSQPYIFTVTAMDNNCPMKGFQTYSYSIKVSGMSVLLQATASACATPGTGSVTALPSGTAPYTYAWSNGQSGISAINGLGAGTYSVTVTDANGCSASANATLTAPAPVSAGLFSSVHIPCNGGNNGSLTALAAGGTAPYVYAWSNGISGPTINNLSPGNYTVTVTDQNGCTGSNTFLVSQPTVLTASVSVAQISCNGQANGAATVVPSGGSGGYFYQWSSGETTAAITNKTAGIYDVTVTDSNNCQVSSTVTITEPTAITIDHTATDAFCGIANGSITTSVSGGSGPYLYSWSPGNSTLPFLNGLNAGLYILNVTDTSGCIKSKPVAISNTTGPVITLQTLSPASCQGGGNGAISISVSGGRAPYNYQWTPNVGTGPNIAGLSTGNYSVRVTDANNCSSTLAFFIPEPPALNTTLLAVNPNCGNAQNGSALVNVSGGTPGYTYNWMPGNIQTPSINNIGIGQYTVRVTDANGCNKTDTLDITSPLPIRGNVTHNTSVSCNGGNNGSAGITVTGGVPPYRFNWSVTGDTLTMVNGLRAGTYQVTITDATNCTEIVPVIIQEPPVLTSAISTFGNVTCTNNNGFATAGVSGGTQPYSFLWLPNGDTSASIQNLPAGNYSVTVTDAGGCTSVASVTIQQMPFLSLSNVAVNNVSCFSGNNGSARVAATGGSGPYTYAWMPSGGNAALANNLTAGSYTATITDARGCLASVTVNVSEPPVLQANVSTSEVSCFGGNDGSASVAVSGGTNPYTYKWNPNGGSSWNEIGMQAGNYSVTITDANGCLQTKSFSIGQPSPILITLATSTSSCGNSSGSLQAGATGGVPGYTYLWQPINSTDSSETNLPAGVYTVIVQDANACTSSASTQILNTSSPVVSTASITPVSCYNGNDGAASITITGGSPPFTCQWSPYGGNGLSANGLRAGNYTIRVNDSFNCETYFTLSVPEPQPLRSTMSASPVNCFGGNTGKAEVSVTGGTSPYQYAWSNGISGTPAISGLSAGNIYVQITDQKGCRDSTGVSIVQPQLLNVQAINVTPVSCYGGNDGSAGVLAIGGNPPYTFSWNPTGEIASSVAGLVAGNYSVIVTDATGCTATTGVIISEPLSLTLQTVVHPGTCALTNGSAKVIVSGGSPPFSYHWNHSGETTDSVFGLPTGNYSVSVSDINGCTSSLSIAMTNTGLVQGGVFSTSPVSCFGGSDGAAVVYAGNGVPPYSFNWQTGNSTTANATGLHAGIHIATITDAVNCSIDVKVKIEEPPPLALTVTTKNISCFGSGNGSAKAMANGGTGAYIYQWQPGGFGGAVIGGLLAGNYSVLVSDENGCTASQQISISEPLPLQVNATSVPAGCLLSNGSATVHVQGGTRPYTYLWNPGLQSGNSASNIPSGTYIVSITDSNNCYVSASVSVPNTTGPSLSLAGQTNVSCFGGNDGSAEINVTGVSPLQFNWYPYGGHSNLSTGLAAENYTVTVRDSNNCLSSIPITISQPDRLDPQVTTSPVSCFGMSDGIANVSSIGGTAPYHYLWTTGDTVPILNQLASGNYSVQVTDMNGCSSTVASVVNSPAVLSMHIEKTDVSCNGGNNGMISVTLSGGNPGYTYAWSNGSQTSSAINLTAGFYAVSVNDFKGCRIDTLISIVEPLPLALLVTSRDASCSYKNDGRASVVATGGEAPYTYQWSPVGGNSSLAENLSKGEYTLLVTDAKNCTVNTIVQIDAPPVLSANITSSDTKCSGYADGSAAVSVSGGVAPYTYFWTNGSDSMYAQKLFAGNYTVMITDNNACVASASVTVQQPPPLQLTVVNPTPICIGQQASLSAHCTGGIPGYTYLWSNGISTQNQLVSPGNTTYYYVQATDSNGCISNTAVVVVRVNEPILVSVGIPDTVCKGNSAMLIANASGGDGGPFTYVWNTGEKKDRIMVTPDSTTSYLITVSDQCGNPSAQEWVTVTVAVPPAVDFTANTFSGCQPLEVNFKDLTHTSSNDYYWNFGDGNNSTSKNPSHVYLDPGNYSVNYIVTDANGCIGKKVIASAVKVYPRPVAAFTSNPESVSILTPLISFSDQSVNAQSWEWDFGDGSGLFKIRNPEHAYNDTGKYIVRLVAMSSNNCRDTAFSKVTVKDEYAVYIPNAFTPNGDGINETFSPLGLGIKDFEMLIFDRWGLETFHSQDLLIGWNGRGRDNAACPSDVYVYKIKITDLRGQSHTYTGRVNLIR